MANSYVMRQAVNFQIDETEQYWVNLRLNDDFYHHEVHKDACRPKPRNSVPVAPSRGNLAELLRAARNALNANPCGDPRCGEHEHRFSDVDPCEEPSCFRGFYQSL